MKPRIARFVLGIAFSSALGAVEPTQRVLDDMEVNLSTALSQLLDTDVAEESSRFVRSQILVDSSLSAVLLAGQSRSQIGALLGA